MRWTLGLLLLGTVGCGYRQTKMVACPETGCPQTYAESSPQGLKGPRRVEEEPLPPAMPPPAPITPLPESAPPPPPLPEPAPMP